MASIVPPYSTALQLSPHGPSFALFWQLKKLECPRPNAWPNSWEITNEESESCKTKVPNFSLTSPNKARPDQIHPARGEITSKYLSE